MNKRTKSQLTIPIQNKPKNVNSTLIYPQDCQDNHIQQELDDLRSKVNQSKPILQSIYDKVKRKQQNYQAKIQQKDQQCQKLGELTKQFRNLHHQSLKIIHKNDLFSHYDKVNNYKSCSFNQNEDICNQQAQQKHLMRNNYQSLKSLSVLKHERSEGIQQIIQKYRRSSIKQEHLNGQTDAQGKSIYEKYKNKLMSVREDDKQNRDNTLNKIRRMSKEIDKDIEQLKLNKNKSATALKKTQKTVVQKQRHPKKDKKQYFLQLQKRKLKNM